MNEIEVFCPANQSDWRSWLQQYHDSKQSVWVVFYSKKSQRATINWGEAVDVALCYGWIDSKKIKIDEHTAHQFFSRRKPKSTWSKINKDKVQRLIDEGLMTKAGLDTIRVAQENGSWSLLDDVEALIIPTDLEEAFREYANLKTYFIGLSKSTRKMLLASLVFAKRPETRQKRIEEIIKLSIKQQDNKDEIE